VWAKQSSATHLVGGDLGYEYLGETNPGSGLYNYRVYMNFYLNCDGTSSFETFYDLLNQDYNTPLPVGVYVEDQNAPNADKSQFTTIDLLLTDSIQIEPDLPSGCGIGQGICTKRGTFEATVTLPLNFGGYHLYYQMCCRNLAITNLNNPNGTGIGYYAFIPPPLVNNNSPEFLGVPTPFLCVGDTTTFLNSAVDPDGDVLIFSFETPYNSYVVGGGITPPPGLLTWPIPDVAYAGGFSAAQPFGSGGYSFINAANGLTEYVSALQGNFIVAVEVKEYRNGLLIGITRRDLQLQVITCPPNTTPDLDMASQQISYTVDAGDQLCFTADFTDLDGDSLFLEASGTIFDPIQFNPAATIQAPDSGNGVVSTTFCWNTGCDQGQAAPYLFSVSVSDDGCPPKTVDVVYDVTVNPFVGPSNIIGPNSVCENAQGTTYGTQTIVGSYQWLVTGGTINGSATDSTVSIDWGNTTSGSVSVIGISPFGCTSDTLTIPVTINALPAVNAGVDTVICLGQSITLGGSPTGPPGSTYTWSPSTALNNPVASNPIATPTGNVVYELTVSTNGCSVTDTVFVQVSSPAVDAGNDVNLCVGDTIQLNGSGGIDYSWTPNTAIINPNSSDPFVFPSSSTTYILTVLDSVNCTASDSVLVTVNNLPIADAGPDSAICSGQSITIGGNPTGPSGSSYSWSNSATLSNAALPNPIATPLGTTIYTVVVSDSNMCVNSDSVMILLNPLQAIDAGVDVQICPGDSVQLSASGASSYSWSPGGTLSDSTIANPWATPVATTLYTVSSLDTNLCAGSDDVQVTVLAAPPADAGPDISTCIGDTAQLNATGGVSYQWSPSTDLSAANISNPLSFSSTTIIYTVVVADTNNCVGSDDVLVTVHPLPMVNAGADATICAGAQIPIGGNPTGPAGSSYAWTPVANLDATTVPNPNASPDSITTYVVQVTDINLCMNTDSITISVNPLPVLDAGPDTSICLNGSVQLNALGSGSFSWLPTTDLSDPGIPDPIASPGSSITYTVSLTDTNNCVSSDDVQIDVLPLPTVDAGMDVWICPGSSIQLQASGGVGYNWSPATGLSDPNIADPVASPAVTTTYFVTITDAGGCSGVDSLIVTVNDDVPIDAGSNVSICLGDSVLLGGNPTSVSGTSFIWSPGAGISDSTSSNPYATPLVTTTYSLLVTNDTCTNIDQVTVTIQGSANADFTVQMEPRCDGMKVYFFNQSAGGSDLFWNFSNGESSIDENPVVLFPFGSDIVATLTVADASGCTSTSTQVFPLGSFQEFASVEMPNVFSPNGDGDNDVFGPDSNALLGPCATMHVFNRWGQRIFTSIGGNVTWSGHTFAGEPAMIGTYFYVLEIEGMEFKGTVTLLR
jgi:gliding motility-associated-like protein